VKNMLKFVNIRPEQILGYLMESLKNLNEDDVKQLALYVANMCVRDREVCKKIYFLSLVITNTCRNILHGGKEGEE
jgi:hypothetical protein